jgi:hypothetical protein
MSVSELEECEPIITNADLGFEYSVNGKKLDPDAPANPCGLVARSYFNDTYAVKDPKGSEVKIAFDDVAWDSDKNDKFKDGDEDWESKQWISHADEHFIVWMRTAGLPDFRKLWGRIDQDLEPGTYTVDIISNWPVEHFDGSKSFVMSTTNELGGKNGFLSICYLASGAICILFGMVFGLGFGRKKTSSQQQPAQQ